MANPMICWLVLTMAKPHLNGDRLYVWILNQSFRTDRPESHPAKLEEPIDLTKQAINDEAPFNFNKSTFTLCGDAAVRHLFL